MQPLARFRLTVPFVIVALLVGASGVAGRTPSSGPREVTLTAEGRGMVEAAAASMKTQGVQPTASKLRVWEVNPGEFVVGEAMPRNLVSHVTRAADGKTSVALTYDMNPPSVPAGPQFASAGELQTALEPSWSITSQGCFDWISNATGELLSCYKFRKMINETWSRDYFSLEQYGTVQAWNKWSPGKIYDGWVAAIRNPGGSTMQWEDWDPNSDLSGSCRGVSLSIAVFSVGLSTSGTMCELWDMTLYTDAGHFRMMWSCGCVFPFGQPYPNSRGLRYLQAVSVPGGGSAIWTLSSGFSAF